MDDPDSIPGWLTLSKTVLLQKTEKLSPGHMGRYMKDHAIRNDSRDEGQLGATEGVLGTVDPLLIDKCIMDEVRERKRDIAVAFYGYRKGV